MSLREYKRKRDFRKTSEPPGEVAATSGATQFVIQKHDASRLHYDFRLELNGTLKSWAVPKGPSLDPGVKVLAVQVEDHPLEYASFEGIIPEGEYGGGTVLVWDRGTWEAESDGAKGLRAGKLKFQLFGEKLHGGWSLVRMSGRASEDGKNWLLIKQRDKYARPHEKTSILQRKPRSVLTDRPIEQIAEEADRVWLSGNGKSSKRKNSVPRRRVAGGRPKKRVIGARKANWSQQAAQLPGARRAPQPKSLKPQLATLAAKVPNGDRWLHELKFDGYRILAFVNNGSVRLLTRQAQDWTHRFQSVAAAFERLPLRQAILDGEIVASNEQGISDFQKLQNSLKRGDDRSLVCYLFDIPYCENFDLAAVPLAERKEFLRGVVLAENPKNEGILRYSDHIEGLGSNILEHACRAGMEGIISKLADSSYHSGRTRDWLKIKCLQRQEFVIGGFTKPSGTRVGFGALLLGFYRNKALIYCGRVGTGFTTQSLQQLKTELKKRTVDAAPFVNPPSGAERRGVTWVKPELVGEVEFTEWTDDGRLRHPSFQGLREDKSASQVVREEPGMSSGSTNKTNQRKTQRAGAKQQRHARGAGRQDKASSTVAGVTITHPNRMIYPDVKLTKLDIARYYEEIADWILPYLAGRPLTLVRCPEGPGGECFYQKHLRGSMPETVHGVWIKEKDGREEYLAIDDLPGLISLVQMSVLEFHPWPAREDDVEKPDMLVFDLDPGDGVEWKDVVAAAREVRDFLGELGLTSFLRTSGGKGLHIVAPLSRRNTWEEFKAFAKGVADTMTSRAPHRYIATMSKAKRRGKLFIDYLRNQRGATAVASYSTRSRPGAPVATPLDWNELTARIKANTYGVTNLPKRLRSLRRDPWKDIFSTRQSLTKKMFSALELD
jgi:bifunctional non-homologous end joining protein LigD